MDNSPAQNQALLRTSKDRPQLLRAAVTLAKSADPADHAALSAALASLDFLERLDGSDAELQTPHAMNLATILAVLAGNNAPPAQKAITALADVPPYQHHKFREQLLIEAFAHLRPLPPNVIAYLQKRSNADSVFIHFIAETLCENASDPALALLEKLFLDPALTDGFKLAWMRSPLLRRRTDPQLLRLSKRLLTNPWREELKVALVSALFDYRPNDWYLTCETPTPPNYATATKEARELFRDIGDLAFKLNLSIALRATVHATLKIMGLEGK